MEELTSFQKSYNEARSWFNSKRGESHNTASDIAPTDTTGINSRTLAVVALMLVQSTSKLNIDTLENYDLESFRDIKSLTPYVEYLLAKRFKDNVTPANRASLTPLYIVSLIQYLFIAQQRGIYRLGKAEDRYEDD